MASDRVYTTLLALAVFVSATLALPLKTCPAFECTGSSDVFSFEPGKTYTYTLETQTSSILGGGTVQHGKLHMSSQVTLQAVSPCSAILTVKDSLVTNSDKKHQGGAVIEGTPVLIGIQNGELVSEICVNKADSLTSINVKRAVASLFQVSTENKPYTNVFGTCAVKSTVLSGADGTTQVNTFRDLNSCKNRETITSFIPSSSYDFDSPVQSLPYFDTSAQLEQRLKDKVVVSASGHEEYHLRPYKNMGNGAVITVSTNITLVSTTDGATQFAAPNPVSVSVIFEAPHGSNSDYSNAKAIENAVKAVCESKEKSSIETAQLARDLVLIVRQSSVEHLLKAFSTFKSQECSQNVLLDAFVGASTGQAVEATAKLIKTKAYTRQSELFYNSLMFNRHPTLGAMKQLATLFDKSTPPRSLVLGAGALVGRYNELHGIEGAKEIDSLLEKIAKPLVKCQASNHEEEDVIITALKGLHNAHYIPDSVASKLKDCLDNRNSRRVRASVLDTIQSDAANKKLKPAVLQILADRDEDSELRIKAYLVAATCPCGAVFETVSKLLEDEPVYQVGNFIASHLRNLRASANPDKAEAKAILGKISVPAGKYLKDNRRYSSNSEFSFSLGAEGVAASAESNVIFSQRSFLPRSVDFNFTVNVLGHSYDLLEVGLRSENLERVLEAYFGPKGYFNTRSATEVLNTGNETVNVLAQKIKERATNSIRSRRSVDRTSVEKLDSKVPHEDNDITVDAYYKLFGYELAFYSYNGQPGQFSPSGLVDKIFDSIDSTIKKSKDYTLKVDKKITLFDNILNYPTLSGFPLKLSTAGTAAVNIELETKIDLPAIVKDPANSNIKFKFNPSAIVDVANEFYIDFFVASSGLKHSATFESTSGVDLNLEILNGKGFDLKVGSPKVAEQRLLHAQTDLFSFSRDKNSAPKLLQLKFSVPRRDYDDCFDQTKNELGFYFCAKLNFPDEPIPKKGPFFPLDGPAAFSIVLKKEDPSINFYNLVAKVHDETPDLKGWSIAFSTPGANNERLIKLLFTIKQISPNVEYKLDFVSPIRNGYGVVTYIQETEKQLALDASLKLTHQDTVLQEYKAKIGLMVVESTANSKTYRPELTYSSTDTTATNTENKENKYKIDGRIKYEKEDQGRKVTLTDLALTIPENKYQLDGFVQTNANGAQVDLAAKYNQLAETAILKSSINHVANTSFHVDVEFGLSKYPESSFFFSYDGKRDENQLENTLKASYGADLKNEKNIIALKQLFKSTKVEGKIATFETRNLVDYPAFDVHLKFDAEGERAKSFHYLLEGGVQQQRLSSELTAKYNLVGADVQLNPNDPGGFEVSFKAGASDKTVLISTSREILTTETSKAYFGFEVQPSGKIFKVNSDLVHRLQKNDLKVMTTSVFEYTGLAEPFTICTGVESTSEKSNGHFKYTKGSTETILLRGETIRAETETGSFKIFVLDHLDGSGTFSHARGKNEGNLEATFSVDKSQRKVVITGKVSPGAKPTARDLNLVVLLNADKDPNSKITLDTSVDILKDGRTYDSKTKLVVLDKSYGLILKGVIPSRSPIESGILYKFDGSLELPSQVFNSYLDVVKLQSGQGVTSLLKFDDGKNHKIQYTGKYKKSEGFEVPTYDVDAKLDLTSDDKNLAVGYHVGNTASAEKKIIETKLDITGSSIPQPFHTTFIAEVQDTPVYKLEANYGSKISLKADTSFNFKDQSNLLADLNVLLNSDVKDYEQIKFGSSFKGGNTHEQSKGIGRDLLEVNGKRIYDISGEWDYSKATSGDCRGTFKLSSLLGAEEKEPRVLSVSHEYTGPAEMRPNVNVARKFVGSVGLEQGNTKILVKLDGATPGDGTNSATYGVEVRSPVENFEQILIKINQKVQKDNKLVEIHGDSQFGNSDDRHYLFDGKVDLSEVNRAFSVQLTKNDKTPLFKTYASYVRPNNNELQGEININVGGSKPRNLAVSGVAKYPGGFDDFDVILNVDSEDMKLNKLRVQLNTAKPKSGSRKFGISAKTAETTYIEGSTTFQKKEQDGRVTIYEGKGDVEIKGQKYSSDIQLKQSILESTKDKENGFDIDLTGSFTGATKKTFESEIKVTNKNMRTFAKFCDEKCSVVEVLNTVRIIDEIELLAENKIVFDIEHTPNSFNLHLGSKFQRKNLNQLNLNFEHKIEAELGKGDKQSKYVYEAFIKDRSAGLYLVTPKRTFAIDGLFSVPESKSGASRSYKGEISVQFDKANQPDQKLVLLSSVDVNKGKDGTIYSTDLKLSHPLLGKDLNVKGRSLLGSGQVLLDASLTLDVFAKKNQAIVVSIKNERVPLEDNAFNFTSTISVSSKAQKFDMTAVNHFVATKKQVGFGSVISCKEGGETAFQFAADADSLLIFARSPSCEIIRVHGDCKRQQGLPPTSKFYSSFLETLVLEGEAIGYQSLKYQAYDKNQPEVRTVYTSALELDKELLLEAVHESGPGASAKLFHLRVALDKEHFLQVDQSLDAEQLKVALERLQKLAVSGRDQLVQCVANNYKQAEARAKVVFESLKSAQPNLQPLINRCKEQLAAIQQDFATDPTISDAIDFIKNFVGGYLQAATQILKSFTEYFEKIAVIFKEYGAKFGDLISKLTPVITEALSKISKDLLEITVSLLQTFTKIASVILDELKKNSADIQKIFNIIGDFVREQSKLIGELTKDLSNYLAELFKTLVKQIETQPILDRLKTQYENLYKQYLERFDGVYTEIVNNVISSISNPEVQEFTKDFLEYLGKKLKGVDVNDMDELNRLSEKLLKLFKLPTFITNSFFGFFGNVKFGDISSLSLNAGAYEQLTTLPMLTSFRVSLFELLTSRDLPTLADLFFTYTVARRMDDAFIPHRVYGVISGSQHIYTFEGDQYTLKGDCQYLLARDFVNGNFSLTAELGGGKLKSVTYVDRKDTVEIKADHTVLLNGQLTELPVHQNDISIFRTLHSVNVKSKYGVEVSSDLHHDLYTFVVNGYYFGKTRGLLGTISNEKYDDLTLPEGTRATTVSQLANAYALSESCQNQAPIEHKHVANSECAAAFNSPAPFGECFKFVDSTPYLHGCEDDISDAQTAEQKTEAICDATIAYVSKCRDATFLQPTIPKNCAQCKIGAQNLDVGQSASVKTPNGKADIVLLVEQTAENSEAYNALIGPLAKQLEEDLNKAGVTDVQAVLIGYGGPGQRYPSLFTTAGKFDFTGEAPQKLTFGEGSSQAVGGPSTHPLLVALSRASEYGSVELGITPLAQAFRQVMQYPFRADANKGVFLLRASDCHKSKLPISMQQVVFAAANLFFKDRGIGVALFQPIVVTSPADKKVIGFDSENALTFTKKGVDTAIRPEEVRSDNCDPYIKTVKPVVFSTKVFLDLKEAQRKQFVLSASSRLTSMLTTETTQDCKCALHEGLHAQTSCTITAIKKGKKN